MRGLLAPALPTRCLCAVLASSVWQSQANPVLLLFTPESTCADFGGGVPVPAFQDKAGDPHTQAKLR